MTHALAPTEAPCFLWEAQQAPAQLSPFPGTIFIQTGSERRLLHLSVTQLYFLEESLLNLWVAASSLRCYYTTLADFKTHFETKMKKLLIIRYQKRIKDTTAPTGQGSEQFYFSVYLFSLYFDSPTQRGRHTLSDDHLRTVRPLIGRRINADTNN